MKRDEFRWEIDPNDLVEECVLQAQMTRAAGIREADARHAHDQCKSRLDVVESETAHAIRTAPDRFGLADKPTIPDIKSAVVRSKAVQDATRELHDARRALALAEADVRAHTDRRKMIERLVDLKQIEYYSDREPRVADRRRREIRVTDD